MVEKEGFSFPVDQIRLEVRDDVGRSRVDAMARREGGRVLGVLRGTNTYQLELPTRSEAELRAAERRLSAEAGVVAAQPIMRPTGIYADPIVQGPTAAVERKAPEPHEFAKAMRALKAELEACRERYRDVGIVEFSLTVAPDGTVSNVTPTGRRAQSPAVECVTTVLRAVRVRPFVGPPVTLTYPISLRAEK